MNAAADPKSNSHSPNVIIYARAGDVPQYELTGTEIVFPISVEQDGSEFRAYFAMSQAERAYEIKEFLDDLITRRRSSETGVETEIQSADDVRCKAFVDRHFVKFYGLDGEPSLEAQRKFLDDNSHLKMRVFREGYDSIYRIEETEETIPTRRLRIGAQAAAEISIAGRLLLYCPTRQAEKSITIVHHLRRENELDRRKHTKAYTIIERRQMALVRANWDVLEGMYDEMVLRLEGYVIDGAPCSFQNKEEWVRRVPFTHKIYAINRVFAGTRVKN